MGSEHLTKMLAALQKEIQSTHHLDPELRDKLTNTVRDIQALLEKAGTTPQATDLAETLRSQAARFAAQHPNIEASLREMAEILGRMGI